MPTISDDDLGEVTFLAYKEWTKEFDNLKKVKNEKPDKSKDWQLFHDERLRRHTTEERKWWALVDRLRKAGTPI